MFLEVESGRRTYREWIDRDFGTRVYVYEEQDNGEITLIYGTHLAEWLDKEEIVEKCDRLIEQSNYGIKIAVRMEEKKNVNTDMQ